MHHLVIEISVTKWCIVGYGIGVLRDMALEHCGIGEMVLLQGGVLDQALNSQHYNDVIPGAIASHITSLTIVYSTVYSGTDRRKHQSSASLAFVRGIHRSPMNSPHKWPTTRKIFPFDDVMMRNTDKIWDGNIILSILVKISKMRFTIIWTSYSNRVIVNIADDVFEIIFFK